MKNFPLIILLLAFKISFSSPQIPDLLIIGNDTIRIYHLPLEIFLSENKDSFINYLRNNEKGFFPSTSCWRGYQGIWLLEDNKLYLKDLDINWIEDEISTTEVLEKTFKEKFINGKVLAEWFSSDIIIPKGKMLRWDNFFKRTYLKEEIMTLKNGVLTNKKVVENYVDLPKGISRLENKIIVETIFNELEKLDWAKLSEIYCDDTYWITINRRGKISKVELFSPYFESMWEEIGWWLEIRKCRKKLKKALKGLQFDIIKWHGKNYEEKIYIELFYEEETNKLENFTPLE